jgi:hypothetical protein
MYFNFHTQYKKSKRTREKMMVKLKGDRNFCDMAETVGRQKGLSHFEQKNKVQILPAYFIYFFFFSEW